MARLRSRHDCMPRGVMDGLDFAVDERGRIPLARDGEAHRLANILRRAQIRRALLGAADDPFEAQLVADMEYLLGLHGTSSVTGVRS